MIDGRHGQVRACNGQFSIYLNPGSPLAWTWAKKKLAGIVTVKQDGDAEGVLVLMRIPNEGEAAIIRCYIGLRQTRDVGPDHAFWLHRKAL